MALPNPAPKWQRKLSGRFRLHLASGRSIDIEGQIRVKVDHLREVIDYEAWVGDRFMMVPAFEEINAIERLPRTF